MTKYMNRANFDLADFLGRGGLGQANIELNPNETLFSQGDRADSVFYLQTGRVRLSVVSMEGKEATITLLSAGDFVGETALAPVAGFRLSRAIALSPCTALKIARDEMIRLMHEEVEVSQLFSAFLLRKAYACRPIL